jgi:hypothetical protein
MRSKACDDAVAMSATGLASTCWRCLLKIVHVSMGNFNMVPGQRARRAHLSLPSSAVLARQPLEYRLPDAVPG